MPIRYLGTDNHKTHGEHAMMKEKFHELQEVFRVAEPVHKAAIQAAIDMYDEGESRPDINDEATDRYK